MEDFELTNKKYQRMNGAPLTHKDPHPIVRVTKSDIPRVAHGTLVSDVSENFC